MEMIDVQSSHIDRVGYSADTRELFIQYKSGKTYVHGNVPLDEAHAFMHAESKGKHFNEHIKPKYPAAQVYLTPGKAHQ